MFSESAPTRQTVRGKQYALAVTVIAVIAVAWLGGCSAPSTVDQLSASPTPRTATTNTATPPDTKNTPVPTSLVDAGEFSENLYDHAKGSDWKKATAKLGELKNAAGQLRVEVKNVGSDVAKLDASITSLETSIAAKDRRAAMGEANRATFIVAQMTAAFKRTEPVEITLLDYYGRELELGAMADDTTKLKGTARDIRRTWDAVLPSIEARGGTKEAQKFGEPRRPRRSGPISRRLRATGDARA